MAIIANGNVAIAKGSLKATRGLRWKVRLCMVKVMVSQVRSFVNRCFQHRWRRQAKVTWLHGTEAIIGEG